MEMEGGHPLGNSPFVNGHEGMVIPAVQQLDHCCHGCFLRPGPGTGARVSSYNGKHSVGQYRPNVAEDETSDNRSWRALESTTEGATGGDCGEQCVKIRYIS
jgi:hypothetical protein